MKREEHNGPDFHYKVLWRPVDDGDGDGDGAGEEESETTHPESPADEDEGDEEDGWHIMDIDDWTRVCGWITVMWTYNMA